MSYQEQLPLKPVPSRCKTVLGIAVVHLAVHDDTFFGF